MERWMYECTDSPLQLLIVMYLHETTCNAELLGADPDFFLKLPDGSYAVKITPAMIYKTFRRQATEHNVISECQALIDRAVIVTYQAETFWTINAAVIQ